MICFFTKTPMNKYYSKAKNLYTNRKKQMNTSEGSKFTIFRFFILRILIPKPISSMPPTDVIATIYSLGISRANKYTNKVIIP